MLENLEHFTSDHFLAKIIVSLSSISSQLFRNLTTYTHLFFNNTFRKSILKINFVFTMYLPCQIVLVEAFLQSKFLNGKFSWFLSVNSLFSSSSQILVDRFFSNHFGDGIPPSIVAFKACYLVLSCITSQPVFQFFGFWCSPCCGFLFMYPVWAPLV